MSETQAPILLDRSEDGVAVLTFNRPTARNALNLDAMQAFADAVTTLADDADLRAVIITGAGDTAFCSGGDLTELSQHDDADFARWFITLMGDTLLRLERLPVPVIAAINGYALGGGSEIAMACDMRVVDATARMGFVQIRLALSPGWGAGQRLMRHVGYAHAMEILLEGRPMHAAELKRLNLANYVTEEGKALPWALHLARKAVEQHPDTVRAIKALLQAGLNHPYDKALDIERDLFPPLWESQAHLDAQARVLESMRRTDDKAN